MRDWEALGAERRVVVTRGRVEAAAPHSRVPGIDGLRGLAVLIMAAGNLGLGVGWVPDWLKHTPDVGFTIADLIAPVFVVLSGFTIGPAIERRRRAQGTSAALTWLAVRSLALIGIGAVITAGQWLLEPAPPGTDLTWGVLQAIGGASLLTCTVILARPWVRVVVALVVLAGYQWLLNAYWLDIVRHAVQNGLPGTLSWGALMMLATAVADAWRAAATLRRRVGRLVVVGLVSTGSALALTPVVPIGKARASATYMLFTLGLTLLALAIFDAGLGVRPRAMLWLQRVGRHPLPLYFAHLLLLAPLTLAGDNILYAGAPPWLTLVEVAIMVGALVGLGAVFDRKGWSLRL